MSDAIRVDVHLAPDDAARALEHDVRAGLGATPKTLPPKWFYDDRGSDLFDEITRLPEYYPTRTERAILDAHATDIATATRADTLVELGSGTSEKTRILLDALRQGRLAAALRAVRRERSHVARVRRRRSHASTRASTCTRSSATSNATSAISRATVDASSRSSAAPSATSTPTRADEFFGEIATGLSPGDALLLGTDLVKEPARLVAAYDDAAGVTAEFNRNVLHVINRDLGADFDVDAFTHVARWDPDAEWMEMRLRATGAQRVTIAALDLAVEFADAEEVRTEISAKFRRDRITTELADAGLTVTEWWTDPAGDFALSLSTPS